MRIKENSVDSFTIEFLSDKLFTDLRLVSARNLKEFLKMDFEIQSILFDFLEQDRGVILFNVGKRKWVL